MVYEQISFKTEPDPHSYLPDELIFKPPLEVDRTFGWLQHDLQAYEISKKSEGNNNSPCMRLANLIPLPTVSYV